MQEGKQYAISGREKKGRRGFKFVLKNPDFIVRPLFCKTDRLLFFARLFTVELYNVVGETVEKPQT